MSGLEFSFRMFHKVTINLQEASLRVQWEVIKLSQLSLFSKVNMGVLLHQTNDRLSKWSRLSQQS